MIFASSSTSCGGLFPLPLVGANVFVRKDGSYQVIKHNGLDAGKIAWTERGIFYSETNSNNWLTTGSLKSTPHENHRFLDGMVVTKDGSTAVSAFNMGFKEEGYAEHITVASPEATTEKTTFGISNISLLAACDNEVFSATYTSDDSGSQVIYVDQILRGNEIGRFRKFKKKVDFAAEVSFYVQQAPCKDNQISFVNYFSTPESINTAKPLPFEEFNQRSPSESDYVLTLSTIDLNKSEFRSVPLHTIENKPLGMPPAEFGWSRLDAQSIDAEGMLTWVGGNGVIYKSEINTGLTVPFNSDLQQVTDHYEQGVHWIYTFSSTPKRINILVEDDTDRLKHPRLVSIDRQTGETLADVTLTGLRDKLGDSVFIQDMAANPNTTIP